MSVLAFKQRFYKYIDKKNYILALTMLLSSIGTSITTSYSTYLSDKNARIERLNQKPLNYIYVDIVSEDVYRKMIDSRTWKSAKERDKLLETQTIEKNVDIKQTTNKKEEKINAINNWLASHTKKKNKNDEIDEEMLKKMQEDKNEVDKVAGGGVLLQTPLANQTKSSNEKKYSIVHSPSKLGKITHRNQQEILPPMKTEIEKPRYFVVKECRHCKENDIRDLRQSGKKQNIRALEEEKEYVGQIGRKEIRKDESIFDSVGRIWRAILHIKEDSRQQRIIDSRYDQYGNRTDEYVYLLRKQNARRREARRLARDKQQERQKRNKLDRLLKNDKKYDVVGYEFEDEENEKTEEKEKMTDKIKSIINIGGKEKVAKQTFEVPSFALEGKLQQMEKYNKFADIATNNNSNANDLQMLAYLEYALEHCWYNYAKKYAGLNLFATYFVEYDDNTNIKNIAFLSQSKDLNEDDIALLNDLKQDAMSVLQSCDISRVKYLSKKNYYLWKKLKITLGSATE